MTRPHRARAADAPPPRRTAESARRDAEIKQGILWPLRAAKGGATIALFLFYHSLGSLRPHASRSADPAERAEGWFFLALAAAAAVVTACAYALYRARYRRVERDPELAHMLTQKKGWGWGQTGGRKDLSDLLD